MIASTDFSEDDLYLGVEALDDDHRHLLEVMNRLLAALGNQADARSIAEVTAEFFTCIQEHFRSEEAQMVDTDYAGIDSHRAAHKTLFETLNSALTPAQNLAADNVTDDLLGFLMTWLGDHILGEDKAFAEFLKAHGAE